jgi:uncharacterized membrane-anchored protein YitT (DUF2179 family)
MFTSFSLENKIFILWFVTILLNLIFNFLAYIIIKRKFKIYYAYYSKTLIFLESYNKILLDEVKKSRIKIDKLEEKIYENKK